MSIDNFAEVYATYREFWNFCNNNHPEILNEFKEMLQREDNLIKSVFKNDNNRTSD